MSRPASIDSSSLDDVVSSSLLDDIRLSIDSSGECYSCLRELGDQDVVIDRDTIRDIAGHSVGIPISLTNTRHASCTPRRTHIDPSWRGSIVLVPNDQDDYLPVFLLNPSVDHHVVARGMEDQHMTDVLRQHGFVSMGQASLHGKGLGTVRRFPHEKSVLISTPVGQWGLGITDQGDELVQQHGGLLICASYRVDATSPSHDDIVHFLMAPDTVSGWVALES